MIKRFPLNPKQTFDESGRVQGVSFRDGSLIQNQDEDQNWIRWAFQSARLRCGGLMFEPKKLERISLIADWKAFALDFWQPVFAQAMLAAWQASTQGLDGDVDKAAATLNQQLTGPLLTRSIDAGTWLLESTRGAKYQGALGRLRQRVHDGLTEPHLPIVWAATAALFQLTPAEMLAAEIAEEWHAAAVGCPEPQGLLSFAALAHGVLRDSSILKFSDDGTAASEE